MIKSKIQEKSVTICNYCHRNVVECSRCSEDFSVGVQEIVIEKDKEIEGLTKQLLESRKEINEMKQNKKKLLDRENQRFSKLKDKLLTEVEKMIDEGKYPQGFGDTIQVWLLILDIIKDLIEVVEEE